MGSAASDQALQDALSFLQEDGIGTATLAKKKPTPSQAGTIAYQPGRRVRETHQPADSGDGAFHAPYKLLAAMREKPVLAAAVGLGLVGVVVIAFFAVTIRIRHPDGKETVVQVPDGSNVSVGKDGQVDVTLPSSPLSPRGRGVGGEGARRPHPNPLPKGEGTGVPPPLAKPTMLPIEAAQVQKQWAEHLGVPVEETNSLGMKLALIPPGEFEMGSTPEEVQWALAEGKQKNPTDKYYFDRVPGEGPRHRVKISKPFYLAMYQVTQAEYEKVMGTNPSAFTEKQVEVSTFKPPLSEGEAKARVVDVKKVVGKDTSRHPVETVNWEEAMEFCRRLSALPAERAGRRVYRLPTEAEWEYACRAGTTTRWYCGDDEAGLVDVAWFNKNAAGMTHPVGEKKPNAWGLYDMHGNAYQWCADWYDAKYYGQSPSADPTGPIRGSFRVFRGGGWGDNAPLCRSAFRNHVGSGARSHYIGLRVCLVPAE